MNTDLIQDDLKEVLIPTGLFDVDIKALSTFILMYSLAVENTEDVKTANEEIEGARKTYFNHYEGIGKLDEFKKAFDEAEENDERAQIAKKHLVKVLQREQAKKELKQIEPTGDIETDARASIEAYIQLLDAMTDYTDFIFIQEDIPAVLGAIMEHYDEDNPDSDAFNEVSERIGAELDFESHMKTFQEKCEAFQALFESL